MGDSFTGASTKVVQASASDLLRDDAGAPKPATVGKASGLEQVDEFSLGYGETEDKHTTSESPTLFITISYAFGGQRRQVRVPWAPGMTLKQAWRKARLIEPLFRHVSIDKNLKAVNGRKVRLTNQLALGAVVVLTKGGY